MRFYGVGVEPAGHTQNSKRILQECLENNVWYMEGDNQDYKDIIPQVEKGDILFAKSLFQAWKKEMRIKAIGVVTNEPLPIGYKKDSSLSVIWIKHFNTSINLEYLNLNFIEGINRRFTIFEENNPKIISEIKRLMRFDYEKENE